MIENYFFIDGSALLSQIRKLQKTKEFRDKKLDPLKLASFFALESLEELHEFSYKRFVFYFANGEKSIKELLLMPDFKKPSIIRDVSFKYCGKKIKGAKGYEEFLETVPKKYKQHCVKSEKGVDIEICCDALRLAITGKIERLFLLTNDQDFLPLCRTLKDFGVNISLLGLSKSIQVNKNLVQECDSYDVVTKQALKRIFVAP